MDIRRKFPATIFLFLILAILIWKGADFVFAADYIKTLETYVYDTSGALSGSVNAPFSLYIGDNISGVANPVKSAYFTIHGVYTGGGTVTLTLNGANSSTYTLPSVAAPTPFQFLYKDSAGIINPTTAGTYSYTFGWSGTGITVYGLGATLAATYQYTPPSCPDGASSNEKIKTLETYVYDTSGALSGSVNAPFSLYIGDNISGVANPVKSAYFTIHGVYTGGGTVTLTLNGANSSTYTLPSVAAPTPFQFLYKDSAGIINPTTAGTYSYTFGWSGTGITVYGLGARSRVSYRYKPPSCGGLPPTGELASAVFETTGSSFGPAYNSLLWKGTLQGGNGRVRFQLATSGNATGPWNFLGGASCTISDWYDAGGQDTPVEISCSAMNHNNARYFRYKIQLCSNNDCASAGSVSPRVDEVVVNWSP